MDLQRTVTSQYLSALEMLRLAMAQCPPAMWDDSNHKNRFWHIAYHTIFYVHLYLQPCEADFVPWEKSRPGYQFMGPTPWPPFEAPQIDAPFTQAELLEYLALLSGLVPATVASLDFAGASGFAWLPFDKLELQFYSIRHLQQHTGELCERLGHEAGIDINWVGGQP